MRSVAPGLVDKLGVATQRRHSPVAYDGAMKPGPAGFFLILLRFFFASSTILIQPLLCNDVTPTRAMQMNANRGGVLY
jgi:hypothetical protein